MENLYGAVVFMIVLQWNVQILTSVVSCLFVSPGCVLYVIFVVAEEFFGSVYYETAAVLLSHWVVRW